MNKIKRRTAKKIPSFFENIEKTKAEIKKLKEYLEEEERKANLYQNVFEKIEEIVHQQIISPDELIFCLEELVEKKEKERIDLDEEKVNS